MATAAHTQVPIAAGLFTWPAENPQLIGSRCDDCGVTTFPKQDSCPGCTGASMEEVLLPHVGTLWTFTVQAFLPKNPPYAGTESADEFVPFGVGYVELPGALKVEARLTEADLDKLTIGMQMQTVVVPLRVDEDGNEVITYAFAPTGA